MKRYKALIVLVIVLMGLNCTLLALFWYNTLRHRPQGGTAADYILHELKLNRLQAGQYEKLRSQHFAFTSKMQDDMHTLRDNFFGMLRDSSVKTMKIDSLERRIAADQMAIDTATFYHFKKLRSILDPEQQARFDHIIQNVLHMMGGREQGRHGPPERNSDMPPQPPPGARP